ncbi:RDD family protein [Prosthecobacter debontii]|uniref:RDD family protein n=2 Tax=Prosthecobacter debontii TaxID=48467 RepID=A0A1T4XZX8_9BACT|nr:RDD family protein [Prosthecobacter debontii]
MLDGLIALVLAVPALIAMPMLETVESGDVETVPPLAMGLIGFTGFLFVLLMIYTIYLLSVKGQTLGKKMLGIRIVNNLDDSNAGFVRAFLLRGIVNAIPGAIIPFYGLIDVCFIFGAERRCIHDFIAGTRVIQG